MTQALGVIDVLVDGVSLDIEKGGTVKLGGWKQNKVVVQGKVHFAREFEESEIDITVPLKRGDKIGSVFAPGARELQVNCDTGQSFIWSDAFVSNRPQLTSGEGGKVKVMICAGEYQELMNG